MLPLNPRSFPINSHGEQVDADDEGGLLEQALAMSMMDGDEVENMRVSACISCDTYLSAKLAMRL